MYEYEIWILITSFFFTYLHIKRAEYGHKGPNEGFAELQKSSNKISFLLQSENGIFERVFSCRKMDGDADADQKEVTRRSEALVQVFTRFSNT